MTNSGGAAECSVRARFDDLRRILGEKMSGTDPTQQAETTLTAASGASSTVTWDRTLGYWVAPGDRRLPYRLLDFSLRQLAQATYDDLARTPGIGCKKMAALVMLLDRALHDPRLGAARDAAGNADGNGFHPAEAPVVAGVSGKNGDGRRPTSFPWETVSESDWEAWRAVVRRGRLGSQPIGRFALSLRSLPSVMWRSPLSKYLDETLGSIRQMKAHGEKRVQAVVEIVYHLRLVLEGSPPQKHVSLVLKPTFAVGVEQWIAEALEATTNPSLAELRQGLIFPILNQIGEDVGEDVAGLLSGRLGLESPVESVIEQAERLRVTRARVYQLLEECAQVMRVRWPEGRHLLGLLVSRFREMPPDDERRLAVEALNTCLFPVRGRPLGRERQPEAEALETPLAIEAAPQQP